MHHQASCIKQAKKIKQAQYNQASSRQSSKLSPMKQVPMELSIDNKTKEKSTFKLFSRLFDDVSDGLQHVSVLGLLHT